MDSDSLLQLLNARSVAATRESVPDDLPGREELVRHALWHGVGPLAWHLLRSAGFGPEPPFHKLRDTHTHTALKNASIARQVVDIARIGAEVGVEVALLKGTHLARSVYPDPGARSMRDIDLLVVPEQTESLAAALIERGYAWVEPIQDVDDYHLPPLVLPDGAEVEIHSGLEPDHAPFRTDIEALWARTVPSQIEGQSVRVLAPEDVLAHVCVHTAFNHEFKLGLRGSCDADALIRTTGSSLDWGAFASTLNEDGRAPFAYVALRITMDLLGTPVPEGGLGKLDHTAEDDAILDDARAFVMGVRDELPVTFVAMAEERSVLARLRELARRIAPPAEVMKKTYDLDDRTSSLAWAYVVRPFDLLRRRAPDLWALLRGSEDGQASLDQDRRRMAIRRWARGEDDANRA